MTNIDIYSSTIKELKAFCKDNNIEFPKAYDKRKRQNWETVIESWKFNQNQQDDESTSIPDNPVVEDKYDADIEAIINYTPLNTILTLAKTYIIPVRKPPKYLRSRKNKTLNDIIRLYS